MLNPPFPSHDDRRAAHRLFGSGATAPRRARAFLRGQLGRWELAHLVETAELLVSELVTNAVQAIDAAASPPIASSMFPVALRTVAVRVRVSTGARSLVIEVWDGGAGQPVPADRSELDEGGRGLALVESMARRWGHYTAPDRGKIVWCELPIARPAGRPVADDVPARPAAAEPDARTPEVAGGDVLSDRPPVESGRETVPAQRGAAWADARRGLPHRVRRHPRAARAEGPDEATLLRVLQGLRNLDVSGSG